MFQHWQGTKDYVSRVGYSWNWRWSYWLFSWSNNIWTLSSHRGAAVGWRGWPQWCRTVRTVSWKAETFYQRRTCSQLTSGHRGTHSRWKWLGGGRGHVSSPGSNWRSWSVRWCHQWHPFGQCISHLVTSSPSSWGESCLIKKRLKTSSSIIFTEVNHKDLNIAFYC